MKQILGTSLTDTVCLCLSVFVSMSMLHVTLVVCCLLLWCVREIIHLPRQQWGNTISFWWYKSFKYWT